MPTKKAAPKKAAMLTAPKKSTYWIAVALAVLGVIAFVLSFFVLKTILPIVGVALLAIGFILLALGNFLKGL